jgi:spermidine synthase
MLLNRKVYFLLAFLEGGCVMAAELLGAKMLAPHFGSSLYVWSTVLAVTLGGLALGYFAGGELSHRTKNQLSLFYVLLLASIFMLLMPFLAKSLLHWLQAMSLIPALLLSCSVFLMPPVFMMGMVSPLIISALSGDAKNAGRIAGSIYAISTCGGILATFFLGFYIIPVFGLTNPSIFCGLILSLIPLVVLIKNKKNLPLTFFLAVVVYVFFLTDKNKSSDIKILYNKEGLLGQLLVVDYPIFKKKEITHYSRILFCNRIMQTVYTPGDTALPYLPYISKIVNHVKHFKPASKVLLLGLGGGVLANELHQRNFKVDAVEFDARVVSIANTYFQLHSEVAVFVDDARHYLNTCSEKYDVLIFDVFKGEENPNHLLTLESLEKAKSILNPGGMLILNGNGYLEGEAGKGMRSIYKTFLMSDFSVVTEVTGKEAAYRNALFFASLESQIATEIKLDTSNALVLRDEFPVLDILNKEANRAWRLGYIQNSIRDFDKRNVPLFD